MKVKDIIDEFMDHPVKNITLFFKESRINDNLEFVVSEERGILKNSLYYNKISELFKENTQSYPQF